MRILPCSYALTGIASGRQTYMYIYGDVWHPPHTRLAAVLVVAPTGGGRLTVNVYLCKVRLHGRKGATPPTSLFLHRLLRA